MKSIIIVARLLACILLSGCNPSDNASEMPQRIPLDQQFEAVSLNGEKFIRYFPTLIHPREPMFGIDTVGGKMACNYWGGMITLDEKTFRIRTNGITAMGCDEYRHHIDRVFLDTIDAIKQWRMEKQWGTGKLLLVLEGESTLLVMQECQTVRTKIRSAGGSGWPEPCLHDERG